jgi:hypothetical protein
MTLLVTLIEVIFGMIALSLVLWAIDQHQHARKKSKQRGFRHD